jgi:hypothetical protein
VTQLAIRRRGFWPFRFWEVREVGSKAFVDFHSRELAVNHALDLAGGDNRLVTVNGRALEDG